MWRCEQRKQGPVALESTPFAARPPRLQCASDSTTAQHRCSSLRTCLMIFALRPDAFERGALAAAGPTHPSSRAFASRRCQTSL